MWACQLYGNAYRFPSVRPIVLLPYFPEIGLYRMDTKKCALALPLTVAMIIFVVERNKRQIPAVTVTPCNTCITSRLSHAVHNTSYSTPIPSHPPAHSNSNTSRPSPPKKKQQFTFVRSKLETKMREFRRTVYLNGEMYDRNVTATTLQNALISNIAVSHSGRTLAESLSLSQPNNLSQYIVDGVTHEPGRGMVSEIAVSSSSFPAHFSY